MRLALAVPVLAVLTLGATAHSPPHRLNKPGSHDSELNDPVAQAAAGNADGWACTAGGIAINCAEVQ
ncbi:hypothetical protein FRC09_002284 [Ceratobasidium sp. 395]|nr:hypothetical protein FRC09_002284 [Ceratobasidium sp. 395]